MRKRTDEDIEVRNAVAKRFDILYTELKKKGVSMTELANTLGVTVNNLILYKNAKAFPSPRVLKALREIYEVNLNWLLLVEDEIFVEEIPYSKMTEKRFFVGERLKTIMTYFNLDFKEFFELTPFETEHELENVLENKKALSVNTLRHIAHMFALKSDWYKTPRLKFNTMLVSLIKIPPKDIYTVFASECTSDHDPLYFAVWRKKEQFGGTLFYDRTDYLSTRLRCSLKKNLLDIAFQQGAYFKLLDEYTFDRLVEGFVHPAKAEGLPLDFPFKFMLREKPLPKIDYKEYLGKPSYGLAKFLYLLSECK